MKILAKQILILFFFLSFIFPQISYSQKAKEIFEMGNYRTALEEYMKLYEKDKINLDVNYYIAMCHLLMDDDKTKAIPFLEFITLQKNFGNEIWFELGHAYQYAYKFDEAIKKFNKFKEKAQEKDLARANREIEICNYAKQLIKKPLDVTFENLGKDINTEFAEFNPFVPSDESYIAFSVRRKGSAVIEGYENYLTADIFLSRVKFGDFTKAKSIGPAINNMDEQQLVGLSPDGKSMLIYLENEMAYGDIYISTTKGKTFQAPQPFDGNISSEGSETGGFVSNDQDIIYFSSDMPGGLGGSDIYFSKKLPTGEFGKPVNLGPGINTIYDESFPRLTDDRNTLFFSSQGHNSMGGFDIFTTKWDPENNSWGPPVNFGYPVNTPEDNMNFSLSKNGRDGYISAYRKGGFGDLDIYRIIFNSVEDRQSIITGKILDGDSVPILGASRIGLVDNFDVEIAFFVPNPKNGKFVMAMSPGSYTLNVEVDGFPMYIEKIKILGKSDFQEMMQKNFFMFKPGESRVNGKKVITVPGKKPPPKPVKPPAPKQKKKTYREDNY